MGLALTRRTDTVGAPVDIVVLAPTDTGCIGIDVDSGALVRAVHHDGPVRVHHPFDVVRARLAEHDADLLDPSQPEAVAVTRPEPVGRLDRATAERLVRPLLHPPDEHILGSVGSAVPYWELDGTRPSVSILEPRALPRVREGVVSFEWRGLPHRLPLSPGAPVAFRPARVVVAYAPPHDGRCVKQTVAVLPK